MHKWAWFVAAITALGVPSALEGMDLSALVGTMEVQFQPIQSAGIKEGCSLVYRVIGQDHAYKKGGLISLAGNITYHTNRERTMIGLSLKIGVADALDKRARVEAPYFAGSVSS